MITKMYAETIEKINRWGKHNENICGVIVIGSQAREIIEADQWSDLDLMVFVNDPQIFLNSSKWLEKFGMVVCHFNYITPLHFTDWDWSIKRVLFADHRDIDFSILPNNRVDEVLSVNKSIMTKGYEVIYDSRSNLLESKIGALLETMDDDESIIPGEGELNNIVNDLLYNIIWAIKKIKRKELWVAVSTINNHINNLLLRLIEIYNVSVSKKTNFIMYDGRYLEDRTQGNILEKLRYSSTRYDENDAVETLDHLIDITLFISKAIYDKNGYEFNARVFEATRNMFENMKG